MHQCRHSRVAAHNCEHHQIAKLFRNRPLLSDSIKGLFFSTLCEKSTKLLNKIPKRKWFNKTRDNEIKRRSNRTSKILNGYENIDGSIFSIRKDRGMRGHEVMLVKGH